jgi:hypothetical protein
MEVTALRSPFYAKGNRSRKYVALAYSSQWSEKIDGAWFRLSLKGLDQITEAGYVIKQLLPNGVELETGKKLELPAIRVRTIGGDNDPNPTTFLLSGIQAKWLPKLFELPGEVMAGTFYRFTRNDRHNPVWLAPHWPEVLVPEWRQAFGDLVRDPAHNPVPFIDRLPWSSLESREIILPLVPGKVPCPFGRNKGELRIVVVAGAPQAVFVPENKTVDPAAYLLRWEGDRIVAEYQPKDPAQRPLAAPGAFDDRAFVSLFEPADSSLRFSQAAGDKYFSFHPFRSLHEERRKGIHPLALQLHFGKAAIQPGATYFFTAFRLKDERKLFIVCFADEAREQRIGWGRYFFQTNDYLRSQQETLDPGEGPGVLRGLLTGQK